MDLYIILVGISSCPIHHPRSPWSHFDRHDLICYNLQQSKLYTENWRALPERKGSAQSRERERDNTLARQLGSRSGAAGSSRGEGRGTNTKLSWPWPDTADTQVLVLATRSWLRGGDLSDWWLIHYDCSSVNNTLYKIKMVTCWPMWT